MSDEGKIKIDKTTGGRDGDDLKGCYFLAEKDAPGCYDFYDTKDEVLASHICPTSIQGVSFKVDNFHGFKWTLFNIRVSGHTARGDWNTEKDELEVGTWEAGTGTDEEAAAAGR